MKNVGLSANEIIEALRKHLILHGRQRIIVVIGKLGGVVVTGEIETIKDDYLEVGSDDGVEVIWRNVIETFSHTPLPTARLSEMSAV